MRKGLVAVVILVAVAGCRRQATYEAPRTAAPATADATAPGDDTWVAQPSDLTAEQVRIVQRALAGRGFQVDATGTFDAATQTALADFQRSRGLPATGNLNADTAAALGVDPREVRPARDVPGGPRSSADAGVEVLADRALPSLVCGPCQERATRP